MADGCILDTCIFNRLADGKIELCDISADAIFYATHVQRCELLATTLECRREELIATFNAVDPSILPTESFCFDVSHFDSARWSDGELFNHLKACLDDKKQKESNTQDALIAEVAIVQELTLITSDQNLAEIAKMHGANVRMMA
jgi:predicted nucleic acid-binding protein